MKYDVKAEQSNKNQKFVRQYNYSNINFLKKVWVEINDD